MGLTRTPVATTVVSLADLKRHIGVTDDNHDRDIERTADAALRTLMRWTGREIAKADYVLTASGFPDGRCGFELPFPPLVTLTSVEYYDTAGVLQTITGCQVDKRPDVPAIVWPPIGQLWPAVQLDRIDAVRVTFTAGSDVPLTEAVQFILLLVRHWYDNPSAVITGTISKEVEFSLRMLANTLGLGSYADV